MRKKFNVRAVLRWPQFSITAAMIILIIIFGSTTESFLKISNIVNIIRQTSLNLIVAIALTLVMTLGGIDLSVGSTAAVASTFASSFIMGGAMNGAGLAVKMGYVPSILCALIVTAALGVINGILITKLKLVPFLVTLAMQISARGIVQVYTNGYPISGLPAEIVNLGKGTWLGIPISAYVAVVLLIVAWIVFSKTRFGRYIFAIGGNEECARLSGIKINRVKIIVYMISALLAGIAGMLTAFRMGSAQVTLGDGYELDAITAAALGGTAMSGGKGYMLGTLLGCLFLSCLSTGFNIAGINSYWQQVLKGIILVLSICLSSGNVFKFQKSKSR